MRYTINSASTKFEFFAPDSGGYVRLESPGHPGTLGAQICRDGGLEGSTLRCGPSVESLRAVATDWVRSKGIPIDADVAP